MSTVSAGSQTLCSSLVTVVAGVGWTSARANIFDDFPVGMKGSPIIPAWEVQAVSHATDGMESMVATFDLAEVKLVGKGGDVGFGSVAPWRMEVRLDGNSFTVCDDKPCPELAEHGFYRLVVVADIAFFEIVDILLVDCGDDGLYCHGVDNHLKMVLHPSEFFVLLQLDEVPSFCVVCNVWVDEGRIFDPGAVEALVSGDKAHFYWSRTSGR